MMELHDVDALAARTKARELAWARDEAGDAVAIDADGTRYILSSDSATLFVVRSHLGGVSRWEESWVRAVLAGPVNQVVTAYVSPAPIVKVKRSRRRTAQGKDAKERAPVVEEEAKSGPGDAGGRAARVLDGETAHEAKAIPRDPTGRTALPSLWTAHKTPEQLDAIDGRVADGRAIQISPSSSLPTMFQEAEGERPPRSESPPPVTHEKGHQTNRTRPKRRGSALPRPQSTRPVNAPSWTLRAAR